MSEREQRIATLKQRIAHYEKVSALLEELADALEAALLDEQDALAFEQYGLRPGDAFVMTQEIQEVIARHNSQSIAECGWLVGDEVKVLHVRSCVVIEHVATAQTVGAIPIDMVLRAMGVDR